MQVQPEKITLPPKDSAASPPRVEAILAGATAAFSKNGFAATSIRQIARAADSSLGGIYYHFDSKGSILRAIIAGNFARVQEALDERLQGVEDPRQAFDIFVANHLEFFALHLDEMRVMAHELDTLTGDAGEEVDSLRRAYTAKASVILHALRPGRAETALRIDVLCLFGMLNWTYRWFHTLDESVGVERLARQMSDLYLRGFLARDEAAGR